MDAAQSTSRHVVETTEVSQQRPKPPSLTGCHIDSPKPDSRQEGNALFVAGWAMGLDGPAVAVEVMGEDGCVLKRIPTEWQRNNPSGGYRVDLARAFPNVSGAARSGFQANISLGTSPELKLNLRAVLADQDRVPIGAIRVRQPNRNQPSAELVSVVIPCFNQGRFLGDAIASAISQTHPAVEVVVVDDASFDNTQAVSERYPGVRYIRQPRNSGVSAARNEGLRQCNGEYVIFLDSDDRLLPDAVAAHLRCFARHPMAAFVWGHCEHITADGTRTPTAVQRRVHQDHYRKLLRENYIWVPGSVMFRRRAVTEIGGFNVSEGPAADYDIYLRIAHQSPIRFVGQATVEYRRHGSNMTRNAALMLRSSLAVLSAHRENIKGNSALRTAYAEGRRYSQSWFGEQLVIQVRSAFVDRDWGRFFRGLNDLRHLYPRGFVTLLGGEPQKLDIPHCNDDGDEQPVERASSECNLKMEELPKCEPEYPRFVSAQRPLSA